MEKITSRINQVNKIWSRRIPATNRTFLIINAVFLVCADIFVMISSPNLLEFLYILFGVYAVQVALYFIYILLSKKLSDTKVTKLDRFVFALLIFKNLVFLLNLIPLIR